MSQQQNQPDEPLDVVEAWGSYMSDDERAQIEDEQWNPDTIKVWPLGPDGPAMTLREVAAWRAEQARMAAELEQGTLVDE